MKSPAMHDRRVSVSSALVQHTNVWGTTQHVLIHDYILVENQKQAVVDISVVAFLFKLCHEQPECLKRTWSTIHTISCMLYEWTSLFFSAIMRSFSVSDMKEKKLGCRQRCSCDISLIRPRERQWGENCVMVFIVCYHNFCLIKYW